MDQITDIVLPTTIACFGVFFIVFIIDYVTNQIWVNNEDPRVRAVIKWTWTVWTPLWPVFIGGFGGLIEELPVPGMIKALGPTPGLVSVIYGAFCGLISLAVVKQVKHALEQKGIDVKLPTLSEAKVDAKMRRAEKKLVKIKIKNLKNDSPTTEEVEESPVSEEVSVSEETSDSKDETQQ